MDDLEHFRNPYAAPDSLEPAAADMPLGAEATADGLKIHGWLLLPALGLIVGPLVSAGHIIDDLVSASQALRGGLTYYPGSGLAFWVTTLLDAAFVVLTVYVARQFFNKRRTAPQWMIRLYVTGLFLSLLEGTWYAALDAVFLPGAIRSVVQAGIGTAIWVPYFLKSKRVQRTFVR